MKRITTTNQIETALVLEAMGLQNIEPQPGYNSCIGITQLDSETWAIIENNAGVYRITALMDCTKAQAFEVFDELNKGYSTQDSRLIFCNPQPDGRVKEMDASKN